MVFAPILGAAKIVKNIYVAKKLDRTALLLSELRRAPGRSQSVGKRTALCLSG